MTVYPISQCLACMGSGQMKDWQAGTCTPSGYARCTRCDGAGRMIATPDGPRPAPPGTRWDQATVDIPDDAEAPA